MNMYDNKKYYFLKLKDDFFDSPEIILLESMENGYKYSNLLLKLYLKSLKNDGKLIFNETVPYTESMISAITSTDVDTVRIALDIFKKLGLIDILSNGAIFMLDIQSFIGASNTEAKRKTDYKKRISEEKTKLKSGQMSQKCLDNFENFLDIFPPEIEIEKEIDIEIEKEVVKALPPVPDEKIKSLENTNFSCKYKDPNNIYLNPLPIWSTKTIRPFESIFEEQGG